MATNINFINGTISDVQRILDLVEAAQAAAAARAQEWQARVSHPTNPMELVEDDFGGRNYGLAEFADVQTALNAMPTILGGWAAVLYLIKE